MKDLDKTKAQLIKELQETRQELISVKALKSAEDSKHKQIKNRLLESSERLDFFVENSPLAIIEWDSDFVVTKWTGNSEKIFGWSSGETIGQPVMSLNLIYEPDIPLVQAKLENLKLGINNQPISAIRNYRKDGEIIYCEWYNTILKDRYGKMQFVMSEVLDITEKKKAELFLQESEERLFAAQEVAKVGSWETNLSTMEVIWSDETYRIFGVDRDKIKTTHPNFLTFVHPDDRERVDNAFIKSFNTNCVNSIKHRIITPGESIKNIEERWRIYFDESGHPYRAVGTCQDLTEITNAQQQNAMLKHALDVFTDGVYWMDSENRFIYVNEAGGRALGYDPNELLGRSLLDVNPKTNPEVLKELWSKLRADGTFTAETVHNRQDGTQFNVEVRTTYFKYEGQEYNYGFARDITERKRSEEALKEKESQYRNLADSGTALIWTSGTDKLCNYFNEPWLNFTGRGIEQELGNGWAEGVHPDDFDNCLHIYSEAFENRKPFSMEYRLRHVSGEYRWILDKGIPNYNIGGDFIGYIGHCLDITEQKNIEQEIKKSKEKAEESDRLKTAFLANMSHEIRTPMNGILGFAELLKEPNLSGEEQFEYIKIIEKSGARMLNIINDIIDISKIESGLIKVNINESNINSQIDYVYKFFKPEVERKGLKLIRSNSVPDEEIIVKTDREKLFAILTNLVKNAIKYSEHGSIEFGYEKKDQYLEFFVKDCGIGIRKERLNAIFERFVQEDISDLKARQGVGLGLAIAKSYVEMLGGKIWAESEIGIGSTFYFTIPFDKGEDNQLIHWKRSIKNQKGHAANLKILIVEDDEISEHLITKGVKIFGKEILKAQTGDQAIEICRNNNDIDLILMDIQLPILGGYDAVRKIRMFNNEVVIIAQTAYGLVGDREKAIKAGCNDYLSKPIDRSELHSLIKKHCGKKVRVSHRSMN